MHNSPGLMAGRERCTLLIHPDDAGRCGVADGDRARIVSRIGAVTACCRLSEEMMHGWATTGTV